MSSVAVVVFVPFDLPLAVTDELGLNRAVEINEKIYDLIWNPISQHTIRFFNVAIYMRQRALH